MAENEPRIPYGRQYVDEFDVAAVTEVLRGDWLTQGPHVERFEQAVATRVQARHAIAFANGTAALHGACVAAGLGPGSTVATSALSFAASANCAKYVGAEVEFVDIDPDTLCMDLSAVPAGLDALIPVHFAGYPMALDSIQNRPSVIIEDAAHALGAWTESGPVGNCAHSTMTCFSFHPVKPVTTGEGGVVTTNDDDLAAELRRFRSHGIVRQPDVGGWAYDIPEVGYNYRLTDIQSALGTAQMTKLDGFIERRQAIAARYDSVLADLPIQTAPRAVMGAGHGYHLYAIRTPRRKLVYDFMQAHGIGVQVHYVPIHQLGAYRSDRHALPNTDAAYEGLLSLPMFPTLSEAEQDRVVAVLTAALEESGAMDNDLHRK